MNIFSTEDRFGNKFVLNSERWNHIIERHPEIAVYLQKLSEAIQNPDCIIQNGLDQEVHLYHKYYKEKEHYIVVVTVVPKQFIVTAYTAIQIKKGRILWHK